MVHDGTGYDEAGGAAVDDALATMTPLAKRDTNAARTATRALRREAANAPMPVTAASRKLRSDSSVTRTRRRRFLDALALTCNATRSAQHAGCSLTGLYQVRQRDTEFAEQWRAALATGYDRLEALMLEHGGAGVSLAGDPARAQEDGLAPPPFDFDKVMKILAFGRAARNGEASRQTGRPVKNATREETNAALLKALAAAARRQAKAAAAGTPS